MGPIRDRILDDPQAFQEMINQLAEHGLTFNTESSLAGMPRGYSEHNGHELAWALRMKNFMVSRPMKRNDWKGDGIVQTVVDFAKATTPII